MNKPVQQFAKPWSNHRAPQVPQQLTAEAQRWLLTLPVEVRPLHLADAYARIVNRMATLWTRPSGADQYLYSLMNDTRGGRRGFPQPIPAELKRLHAYYEAEIAPNIVPEEWPTTSVRFQLDQGSVSAKRPAAGKPGTARDASATQGELDAWIANWLTTGSPEHAA